MFKKAVAICVVSLVFGAAGLHAQGQQTQQDVFVVPGANSTANTVLVYSSNPFSSIMGFTAGPGTFQVLATPDGNKFYAIANSGSGTVTEIGNSFTNPKPLNNLGSQAVAAAMSEDGKRLAVAAGTLHIFDTTTDTDLVPNGISFGTGYNVFDVASSLDGKTFYALAFNAVGGSVLAAVDASSSVTLTTLPITGPTVALAVGPNGLIYVSAPNQILEVNPNTLALTSMGPIRVNARPGKLVFTPDGMFALAPNQTPVTGSAVLVIGLSSHAVVNSVPNFGVTIDQLKVMNSTTILGYATQNLSLYQVGLSSNGNVSIGGFSFPTLGTASNVAGFAFSNEVAAGGRTVPQYLYVLINGVIYREDLTTNNINGQFSLSITPGGLSFAGASVTGAQPATLLQYGNTQVISPNTVSAPVVLRVLDNNGNPINGVTVAWSSNNGSTVSPTTSTTGANGYAVTYVTAGSTPGPMAVTATAGTQIAQYTMTVGSGGTGPSTGGLVIIAGQGQLLSGVVNTGTGSFGSPFIVQLNDANGNPIPNVGVTFSITQGAGTLPVSGTATACSSTPNCVVVVTDVNGQASEPFLTTSLAPGVNFASTTVNVSAPSAGSLNLYVTTLPIGASATARLLAPNQGDTLSGPAGATLPGAVKVAVVSNTGGQGIPNVSIRLTLPGSNPQVPSLPGAQCSDPMGTGVLTGADGNAVCDVVLNGHIGSANLVVNAGYSQSTPNFNIQITAGPPGVVTILNGNNQTGNPGQLLPQALAVRVTDAFGNILANTPVAWSVLSAGTVTLSSVSTVTDSTGAASARATLGNVAGNALVKVTAGSVSATFTLTVNIPAAGIQKISGDSQTTLINTGFPSPLVVKVVDSSGNAVQGATVTFTATGGATVAASSVTTGASGQASTTVTAGASAGAITVTASTASFSTTFSLTARLPGPSNVTFANAAFPGTAQQSVAPGEIVVISGSGIAPGVQGLQTAYNIIGEPVLTLAGISVTFNGINAPMYWVLATPGRPDQVAVQVPFELQPGSASVVINSAGGGSGTFTVSVAQFAPGIFETTIGGQNFAIAVRPNGSYVTPSNPAHPGETIRIYVNGLGQVTPAAATGSAGAPGQSVAGTLIVGLNNAGVPFIAAEYAPGMVGVYVITLQIPTDAQTGPAQPLGVIAFDAAGNAYFAQGSVIPIQ